MYSIINFVPLWTIGPLVLVGLLMLITTPKPGPRHDR
jgi:hypothetical protein